MNIIDRIKNIIVSPKTEWLVISAEPADAKQVAMTYVLPLVLAGAAAAFIGYGFLNGYVAIGFGLFSAISAVLLTFISIFVSAFVVDALDVMYLIVSVIVLIVVWAVVGALLVSLLMPIFGLSQLSRFGGMA
ncbi:MAG: hypothetical protein EOP49_37710 [Sphingobacteriales bacterium]|nr:MAG: hypothetical protein EOP49_37710 [Sphingobacteriales bacterium]